MILTSIESHLANHEMRTYGKSRPTVSASESAAPDRRHLGFQRPDAFERDLRERVEAYFQTTGISPRDQRSMITKSVALIAWVGILYSVVVFAPLSGWSVAVLSALLGTSIAGIGFNIQHDGGHNAYSDRIWVNRLSAAALDLIGASSYVWRWKHNLQHHTYVNIAHHDTDIDLGLFGRVSPDHPRHGFHRWQHVYIWPLYGIMALKWHWYDDFHDVATGRLGARRMPRPRGWDLVQFVGGKLLFAFLALGLPCLFHPWAKVLGAYLVVDFFLGLSLSVVFQLAHAVEPADFPQPDPGSGEVGVPWARHQVRTTVDFSRGNALVTWFLGGLNHQVEHHLFPRVCHVHYPAIAPLVEAACKEHGVPYLDHGSFGSGLASHYRWLKRLGLPDRT